MAEIRKRGDTYQISVFLGRDEEGKKLYKRTTFTPTASTPKAQEKELDSFAKDFEKRAKEGDIYDGETMTFSQFVPIWRENVLPLKSPKQRESYERDLQNYIIPVIGHMKLSKIKALHIDKIMKDRKSSGRSSRTVHFTFTVVNSVMEYAFKKSVIRENPCLRCDDLPPVVRDSKLHYFSVEQAKTFLHALTLEYPEERDTTRRRVSEGNSIEVKSYTMYHKIPFQFRPYFSIAIFGGLRRAEIVSLTWEDIDFDTHTISVKKSISHPKSGEYVKATKTGAGMRDIVLPNETFSLLSVWKSQEKEIARNLGTAWKGYIGEDFDKNWIFIDMKTGNRMSVDTPSHKFEEIIAMYNKTVEREEDKLPRIRLHDLRHTSATLLLANNCDIETVSKRLGHSRASITLDIYGHAMKEKDITASQTLERIFA